MADQADPTDGITVGDQPAEQPAAPETAPPETPQPAETPGFQSDAPWAKSLTERFQDVEQQRQVDAYLREEIQPYITRREQELGQVNDVWNNLWDEEQSIGTYLALTEEMYGPEFAQAVAQQIVAGGENGQQPEAGAEPQLSDEESFQQWLEQQPPQVQEMMQERLQSQEDQQYEAELDTARGAEPTITGLEHMFSQYVVAADGDVQMATETWREQMAPTVRYAMEQAQKGDYTLAKQLGLAEEQAADAAPDPADPGPPAVLGTTGAAGTATGPTVPGHRSMDEAMEEFFAEVSPQTDHGGLV